MAQKFLGLTLFFFFLTIFSFSAYAEKEDPVTILGVQFAPPVTEFRVTVGNLTAAEAAVKEEIRRSDLPPEAGGHHGATVDAIAAGSVVDSVVDKKRKEITVYYTDSPPKVVKFEKYRDPRPCDCDK